VIATRVFEERAMNPDGLISTAAAHPCELQRSCFVENTPW
jgi:hypothetical protein